MGLLQNIDMIRFCYSPRGQYNILEINDVQETFIVDKAHNKLLLFGSEEFYFQKNSDIYKSDQEDIHLSASLTGMYNMYSELTDTITLNYEILKSDIDLLLEDHNTDVSRIDSDILDLSIYAHTEDERLDSSIVLIHEWIQDDEEVWAAAYNAMDSSIQIINTSVNILESKVVDNQGAINETVVDLSTYTHNNISNISTNLNVLNSSVSLLESKVSDNLFTINQTVIDLSIYAHNNVQTLEDSIRDLSIYAHTEDTRLDSSIMQIHEWLRDDEEVWAAAYVTIDSSIDILDTSIRSIEDRLRIIEEALNL